MRGVSAKQHVESAAAATSNASDSIEHFLEREPRLVGINGSIEHLREPRLVVKWGFRLALRHARRERHLKISPRNHLFGTPPNAAKRRPASSSTRSKHPKDVGQATPNRRRAGPPPGCRSATAARRRDGVQRSNGQHGTGDSCRPRGTGAARGAAGTRLYREDQ
jgi:hypothetical protein